jgi:hypothetical protein
VTSVANPVTSHEISPAKPVTMHACDEQNRLGAELKLSLQYELIATTTYVCTPGPHPASECAAENP